ncbi:MAG: ribosome biogenesis GTPase Der, partial [Parcubacteria group bacterium]|nr:ribosome biogenesis GTPase Der [Parcubacteria group bacterium]
NVGKSTLFNRLTESDQAIVSKIGGTTRDRNVGEVEWVGKRFTVIDTGGLDLSHPDDIEKKVFDMAWRAMKEADLVALVVDAKDGLLPQDKDVARQLRAKHIDFIIIANKADSPSLKHQASEFFALQTTVFPVSAANGTGTGDLLDYLLERFFAPEAGDAPEAGAAEDEISITLAGLPNVGKSSLVNALLGREEVLVSPEPHTTRESRDVFFQFEGRPIRLVDTAGVRKTQKLRGLLTQQSAKRSLSAIRRSHWVVLVVDATQDHWGEQEHYIVDEIMQSGASIIVAANKWDMLTDENRYKKFRQRWEREFGHYPWIPVIATSAKSGWHITRLLKTILELHPNRSRQIPQSALDRLLKKAVARRRPQKKKGPEAPYIHAIKQVRTNPPHFEVVIDYDNTLAEFYVRYLTKVLRSQFDFEGTPLRIHVRAIK